ncbi:hypothetical protein D3C85_1441700 [compost metagenome]
MPVIWRKISGISSTHKVGRMLLVNVSKSGTLRGNSEPSPIKLSSSTMSSMRAVRRKVSVIKRSRRLKSCVLSWKTLMSVVVLKV